MSCIAVPVAGERNKVDPFNTPILVKDIGSFIVDHFTRLKFFLDCFKTFEKNNANQRKRA